MVVSQLGLECSWRQGIEPSLLVEVGEMVVVLVVDEGVVALRLQIRGLLGQRL